MDRCRRAVKTTRKQSLVQQARAHKALGVVLGAAAAQPGLPQAERAASQDEGLLHLRQALEIDPQDADVLYNLGVLEVGSSLSHLDRCALHGLGMAPLARVYPAQSLREGAGTASLEGRQADAQCWAARGDSQGAVCLQAWCLTQKCRCLIKLGLPAVSSCRVHIRPTLSRDCVTCWWRGSPGTSRLALLVFLLICRRSQKWHEPLVLKGDQQFR